MTTTPAPQERKPELIDDPGEAPSESAHLQVLLLPNEKKIKISGWVRVGRPTAVGLGGPALTLGFGHSAGLNHWEITGLCVAFLAFGVVLAILVNKKTRAARKTRAAKKIKATKKTKKAGKTGRRSRR